MNKGEIQIPILNDKGLLAGTFVSFSDNILNEPTLLIKFAQWRNDNLKFFLNQEKSTFESTGSYIRSAIDDPQKNMFLMLDVSNRVVGHFGFNVISEKTVELDNLLRTNEKIEVDFVLWAERAMIQYIFEERKYSSIQLRMLSSNVLARRLHESIGFELSSSSPLMKVFTRAGGVRLVPSNGEKIPDAHLLEFELDFTKNIYAV